jgi:hypothetical protein
MDMNLNKSWLCDNCIHRGEEWVEEGGGLEKVELCAYYKIYFPYASTCTEHEVDRDTTS